MGGNNQKPEPRVVQVDPQEAMLEMKMTIKKMERESQKATKEEKK